MGNYIGDIAVIDDGINEKAYGLIYDIEITPELKVVQKKTNINIISHGTTCAGIIKKYAPGSRLSSIKILNSNRGEKNQLIKALYWCFENGIRLVNLSLGSIDFRDFNEIRDCVNKVVMNGLIIVAASNNKNIYTVPACLTNVIGVKCNSSLVEDQYLFHPYALDGIDVIASGKHCIKGLSGDFEYTVNSNSFSAPLITAKVHKILIDNSSLSLEEIKKDLSKGSRNHKGEYYNPNICMFTDWVRNYYEIDLHENSDIFDTNKINDTEDTVVINTIHDKVNLFENNKLITKKNMVIISDLLLDNKEITRNNKKYWINENYKLQLEQSLPEKLINIDIPIIIIYGEIKNEFYIFLKTLFFQDGYYALIISTECKDVLIFGCEYLPEKIDTKKYLSFIYEKFNCDILLFYIGNNEEYLEKVQETIEFDIIINFNNNLKKIDSKIINLINNDISKKRMKYIYKKIKKILA